LTNGQVGNFAQTLTTSPAPATGGVPYFCNLVGVSFSPCATNVAGFSGAGAGFPINSFQANPYASGIPALIMDDTGYSNYNSLQVDFRLRPWHGLQFDANYTWSHTLGTTTPNDWTGAYPRVTLRDINASYAPTLYDLRHVIHISGTVDLPFGKGKLVGTDNSVVDHIIGGWSLGTILTYQTGFPYRVLGGFSTFNNFADDGVILVGISRNQLQSASGVFHNTNNPTSTLIDPKYLASSTGGGVTQFMRANTVPGTYNNLWIYGPHGFYNDLMISKTAKITERVNFVFQTEFLNVFNHPVWGQGTSPVGGNIRSGSWGSTGGPSNNFNGFGRQIEMRATINF
jgi:hypothetical protein